MKIQSNEFFRQITLRMCSTLDIEKALSQCLDYFRLSIPLDEIAVDLIAPELGGIRRIAHISASGETSGPQIIYLPTDKFQAMLKHLDGNVYCVKDTGKDPYTSQLSGYVGNIGFSEILLPLKIENNLLGLLILRARGKDIYTEKHAALVCSVREPISIAVANALSHQRLHKDNLILKKELKSHANHKVIGEHQGLQSVMMMVKQVASLNTTVLLTGETGVGKEVIANSIHNFSTRHDGPFVKVNCGAIPENLIDSELFGHEKGSFSGAHIQRAGRFEKANKGTIFLDEIGELPLAAQVRLLRVLQFREIERIGGTSSIPVDIRIIAATHRRLDEMVKQGQFREDLWFRLTPYPIAIPPLRERICDLPELISHIISVKSRDLGLRTIPPIKNDSIEKLSKYPWPGNVRELENVIERALIQTRGQNWNTVNFTLPSSDFLDTPEHVHNMRKENNQSTLKELSENQNNETTLSPIPLEFIIKKHIRHALSMTSGKVHGPHGAALWLGLNPSTLRNKMRKLGIKARKTERQ